MYPEDNMEQVTIILPTYNRASSVEKAIESVRKQTYPAWKLIVVDDGSTDGTWELVQKIKEKRIRYVRNEKRGGVIQQKCGSKIGGYKIYCISGQRYSLAYQETGETGDGAGRK